MGKVTAIECAVHKKVKQIAGGRLRCKECVNEQGRNYFYRNKDKYRDYRRKGRAASRKVLQDAKAQPCFDCGVRYPYYVMDFDHRPGEEKKFLLSHSSQSQVVNLGQEKTIVRKRNFLGSNSFGREAIEAEIAKCDVVCSNCHRERTHQRRTNKLMEDQNEN